MEEGIKFKDADRTISSKKKQELESVYDSTFNYQEHNIGIFKSFSEMRFSKILTDIYFNVDGREIHAHKVILAAASPYFNAMFTGGLRESVMKSVPIHGVPASLFEQLINLIYTGRITFTESLAYEILPVAIMFQVDGVIEASTKYLVGELNPSNSLRVLNFSKKYDCLLLYQEVSAYIRDQFLIVSQCDEYKEIGLSELSEIIEHVSLNVNDERDVVHAILRWIEYDLDWRRNDLQCLLKAARCHLLSPKFITDHLLTCDTVRNDQSSTSYLTRVLKEILSRECGSVERFPSSPAVLFVAGGYHGRTLCTLEGLGPLSHVTMNLDTQRWVVLPKMLTPRSGFGGDVLLGRLYIIGGVIHALEESQSSNKVEFYDIMLGEWKQCCGTNVARNRLGVAVLDHCLYAVGGSCERVCLNSVEKYCPEGDTWVNVASMSTPRFGLGVAVVNRCLYAIGGFNMNGRLSSVEKYDPDSNKWTPVKSLQLPRSGAGVAKLEDKIYVVGGYDGRQHLNTVEVYDCKTDEWKTSTPMPTARSALTLTEVKGLLYAVGGYNGGRFLQNVEVYDPDRDTWTACEGLSCGRSKHVSFTSCVPGCLAKINDPV